MRWILWIWLPAILLATGGAEAAMETEEVRGLLEKMQAEEAWGEAVFTDGRVRSLRVEEIEADSVAVVEVVGALQEREAAYALAEIRSLRSLGTHRIQARHAAYRQSKSGLLAFLLEATPPVVVPGYFYISREFQWLEPMDKQWLVLMGMMSPGYFYIGEHKEGLALMGLTAAVVGTAYLTGTDTAAGWVPLVAWVRIASLFHLRDQVQAINKVAKSVELGALPGRESTIPALRLKLSF